MSLMQWLAEKCGWLQKQETRLRAGSGERQGRLYSFSNLHDVLRQNRLSLLVVVQPSSTQAGKALLVIQFRLASYYSAIN
ncbi:hypothetical protein [Laribacter hongkongensis]|uniref:hypothetical protein n=1 Tax=Laribacter hongkongensis TaxID=168471 RepID=UPI004032F988